MKVRYIVAIAVFCSTSAASASMNAQSFYAKAVALEKKGMGAMLSKDLKPVMNEMKASGAAVKAENEAAKKAGSPLYCPPEKSSGMNSKQLLALFGAIPESRRKSINVKTAWKEILIKKFPC